MNELSALAEKQRLRVTEEIFSFKAGKNDRWMPLAVNATAILLLLAAASALFLFFNRRERFITSGQAMVLTTEGRLLEAVRQDAQNQISRKELELAETRKKLEDLNQEREKLRLESAGRLRQREEELQAAMNRMLEAEREKLQTQGLSARELEVQLLHLREQIESKNQQDLVNLNKQLENERNQREIALKSLESEYMRTLERLDGEKNRLQEQLRQQERELSERFRRETAALESERAKTAESLAHLSEQRRQEQLLSDQILSFYEQLRGDLAKPDYEKALATLSSFESFLAQGTIASLPALQRRRPLELFVIHSFRNLIDRQRSAGPLTADSLLAAAETLASIRQAVSQADQAYRTGQTETARGLYLTALSKIPELQHTYTVLNRLDQTAWRAERQALEDRIGALQLEISQRQKEFESKEQLLRRQIAGLQQELERARSDDLKVEAASMEKRRRLLEGLQSLRNRYEQLAPRSERASEQELTALLETKLLLKEILVSEPVRARFPDLYDKTEQFLQVFSEVLLKEGQLAALRDLSSITASLAGEPAGEADAGTLQRYADVEFRDLFHKMLDALRLMVP